MVVIGEIARSLPVALPKWASPSCPSLLLDVEKGRVMLAQAMEVLFGSGLWAHPFILEMATSHQNSHGMHGWDARDACHGHVCIRSTFLPFLFAIDNAAPPPRNLLISVKLNESK